MLLYKHVVITANVQGVYEMWILSGDKNWLTA